MLGEILEISNNIVKIRNSLNTTDNIINYYMKIEDNNKFFVGEIITYTKEVIAIKVIGEIKDNKFIHGISSKPSFASKVSLLSPAEIKIVFGLNNYNPETKLYLGKSSVYENYPIYLDINNLFANHLVILGNTGSGKSCGVARLLQNLFYKKDADPINTTFFIIDAYGEYENAFKMINYYNKDLQFKSYKTKSDSDNLLQIPLWLLSLDDICLLLEIKSKNQIPIVEKALKLVNVFKREEEQVIKYKNSIIASALLDIFINGKTPAQIRDQIFSVLTRYNTKELNLDSKVYVPGYTRPLRQCLLIDDTGKLREMELVVNFLKNFILEEMQLDLPDGSFVYSLNDLLYAFDFALISEGILNNEGIYNIAHELRVRLSSLADSELNKFFTFDHHFTKKEFFYNLTHYQDKKVQVINLNLSELDDRFAKIVAKMYSKFLFDYVKYDIERATLPVHIILEEAHRYVQQDTDLEIIGYNIFERIAKEGRKYGVLLNLISQRPSELSQTVLSQCSNFLVFKITHPIDIEYIRTMIPFVDDETIEKIKNLQIGHCLVFGSALMLPTIVKVDLASPTPNSSSCNVAKIWFRKEGVNNEEY